MEKIYLRPLTFAFMAVQIYATFKLADVLRCLSFEIIEGIVSRSFKWITGDNSLADSSQQSITLPSDPQQEVGVIDQ
jgi:hypothetical protein